MKIDKFYFSCLCGSVTTPYNTHFGAVVGALPLLIGAAAAQSLSLSSPCWLLFLLQLLWQFPHFYILAWLHRLDYKRAGFRMMPIEDSTGEYTARISKPYVLAMASLPLVASLLGVTSYMFVVSAAIPTAFLLKVFCKFQAFPSKKSAKNFFIHQMWYLLAMLTLATYHALGVSVAAPSSVLGAESSGVPADCCPLPFSTGHPFRGVVGGGGGRGALGTRACDGGGPISAQADFCEGVRKLLRRHCLHSALLPGVAGACPLAASRRKSKAPLDGGGGPSLE
eukprot:GHVT01009539.1.p1 GENE.GHVT01009539.1~~GHVT01009539.1.p1  ORF type:complete len:281 (+),score=47.83 GHVT01009539.1:1804-2646(+)